MAVAPDRSSVRVLVADDSAFMRRLLTGVLQTAGFDVVGAARDGDEALALCRSLRPDALTLDLAMPGMDGIEVLRHLRGTPPAVVVSAFSPAHGARAVDALAEGAFDLTEKPGVGESLEAFGDELAAKLDAAARSPQARRARALAVRSATSGGPAAPRRAVVAGRRATSSRVLVIATSTGGPKALADVVPQLPAPLGCGTLIVQHMPAGFTELLAQRLDKASSLQVREAAGGELIEPGVALVAPGGRHLHVGDDRRVSLGSSEKIGGVCPRADLTIADAAEVFGRRMVLAVLTGMGKDGLAGAEAVRRAGGRVVVEHSSTCTVYGMPRAVEEAGLADAAVPLPEMAAELALEMAR